MKPFWRLLGLLVLALPAAWLGYALSRDPGQVWIAWGRYQVDTSLVFLFGVGLLLALAAFGLDLMLRRWPRAWRQRRARARRRALLVGLKQLAEGRYRDALPRLHQAASDPEQRHVALHYAALAADEAGDPEQARRTWQVLRDEGPLRRAAAAELAAREAETDLSPTELAPIHARRRLELARARGEAAAALAALTEAERRQALAAERARRIRRELWPAVLQQTDDPARLERHWTSLGESERSDPVLLDALCAAARRLGRPELGRAALEHALRTQPSAALFERLADWPIDDPRSLAERVEAWLRRHPESAALYRLLGRCRLLLGERAAARAALDQALVLEPHAAAWADLGRLADLDGDLKAARDAYARAVEHYAARAWDGGH